MPRITLAIEETIVDFAKREAAKAGISTSRFVRNLIERESAKQKAPRKRPKPKLAS